MREPFMLHISYSDDAAGKVDAQVNFQFSAFLALNMQCKRKKNTSSSIAFCKQEN